MAGVDLGSIVAHLRLEMSDFNSNLNRAVEQVQQTQNSFSGLKATGESLSSVGAALTAGVTAPVVALGASVVQTQMKFQDSMAKVKALSGATGKDFQMLEDTAKKFGESTVFSASECADALGYMALAGWDAQQSADGLPGVLNLAAASSMDLADASDLVTDYLTAFGLEADQAGRMADVLSYAQANSNTTTEMLGEAFKNCAVNAHNAGMSLEETTAILGRFADAGLKGSEGGTALNAIIRDMTQKMKNGAIQIGNTSVKVQDANGNFRSMTDIIRDVDKATEGMGDAQKTAALMTTFTADSIKGMGILCNTGADNIDKFTNELKNSDGTAEDMANTLSSTLSGALKELSSAWEGFQLNLGDTTGVLTKIVNGLTLLVRWLKSLPAPIQQAIVTFALLAAAVGPILLAFGKLITFGIKVKENFAILKGAISVLSSGIMSLLDTAITALYVFVTDTLIPALSALWGVLMANPIILVVAAIAALVAGFIWAWNNIDGFKEFWINLWENIKTVASNAIQGLQNFFTQTVPQMISDIGNWFSNLPETIWYWLCYAVAYAVLWVGQMAQKAYEAGSKFVQNAITFIQQLPGKVWTWLTTTISRVGNWVVQMASKAQQAGSRFLHNVSTFIQQLPGRVWSFLLSTIAKVISFAVQFAQKGREAAQRFKDNIINGISSLPGKMVSIGSNIIHGIITGITNAAGNLFSTMQNIASRALNAAKDALGIHSPSTVFRDMVGKMIPAGVTVGIEANAGKTIQAIKDYAKDLVTTIDTNKFLGKVNMSTAGININSENTVDSNLLYAIKGMAQAMQDSKQEFDYKEMGKQYRKALQDTNTPILMDKVVVGQKVAKSVQDTNDYYNNQKERFRGEKDYV
nr:MAG TPA: minor tail protein [Caudoviricetes sp.]